MRYPEALAILSLGWLDPVATRAVQPWTRRSWWPRSDTLATITDAGIKQSDTHPIGGLVELADWTLVVDGWFNRPRSAITAT